MDNGANSYRRFLDGDRDGMVDIIKDYKDGLIFYLNTFIGNITLSEELMEEVFVKLVTKKPRFKGKSSFKTWLYAIGRNIAIDYIRHRSKLSETPMEELYDEAQEESAECSYIREEDKLLLHNAMRDLNPEYRQVLYLIFFEGFDNGEAALVMKKSKRQIENLVYHAKISLRTKLEQEGFIYEEL